MWYAIAILGGLLLGVGFLIYGLIERSKRAKAEKAAAEASSKQLEAERQLQNAHATISGLQAEMARAREAASVLRAEMAALEGVLAGCKDGEAVKTWLTSLLAGGPV